MPFLKLVRVKKPVPYSPQPAITDSLMPFPRCQGRQPFQNLSLLIRHRYLAVIPHILVTVRDIAAVVVYGDPWALMCCRIHLV
ncbi:hypothetical protein L873DRAFT_592187 [Choiromyces venosus 120613-1]|uniref:Uncharacterized protein n=1 Tax=Choiromyces venosus 120613-1 TaxID=1336337 RepID=A0A3N4J7B3_9PEZI|nr:hypothetical protein L873DRAFT_592187 [Choiromyces venosus 120613-1]